MLKSSERLCCLVPVSRSYRRVPLVFWLLGSLDVLKADFPIKGSVLGSKRDSPVCLYRAD